jgi:phosphoribosylanthranilate isomerase
LHAGELFVAGGLTAENVGQAIREARPSGVDVAGGIEGPDGYKDRERVRAFVRAARGGSR